MVPVVGCNLLVSHSSRPGLLGSRRSAGSRTGGSNLFQWCRESHSDSQEDRGTKGAHQNMELI